MFLRVVFVVLFALTPLQLAGQSLFDVFSFPKTIIATGQTEVIGTINVALQQGTTLADTLVIDVSPYRVTNANPSDIRVMLFGNITTGAIAIEAPEGRVRIPVNAGAKSGLIRIDGIRVAVAGKNATAIEARLKWAGNQNLFPSAITVRVVDQVQSGLVVEPGDDRFAIYGNLVLDSTANFIVKEGFKYAFTNTSDFGQTAPTRLKIRLTELPGGVSFRFPATVTTPDSSATLTTDEGTAVVLPRADGTAEVTYNFNGAGNSADVLESFKIPYTVTVVDKVGTSQPSIDVTLAAVGAAEPSEAFPSTDIPRFAADYLNVLEGTSRIITKSMYWTGIDSSLNNSLFVTNPSLSTTNLTFTATRADGQLLSGASVVNPAKRSLSANQSLNESLSSLFGTAAGIATVRIDTTNSSAVALATSTGAGLAESLALPARGTAYFTIPSYDESGRISLFNPSSSAVSGTLRLLNPQGAVLGTKSLAIAAQATATASVTELFQLVCPAVFPSTCYNGQLVGSFDAAVVAVESSGSAGTLSLVVAQPPAELAALYVPFFASGNGFETDLNLTGVSDQTVTVTAQIFNNQGVAAGSPESITLVPSAAFSSTVTQLFKLQTFTTGYIRISVPQMAKGPWYFYPLIQGFSRIRTSQASTVVPLSGYPLKDGAVLNSGTTTEEYQGLAIVNPNGTVVSVTLEVLNSAGTVTETQTVNLGENQIVSRLTSQIFSSPIAVNSVIRITGSLPVVATSITGTFAGDLLRSSTALK